MFDNQHPCIHCPNEWFHPSGGCHLHCEKYSKWLKSESDKKDKPKK